MSGFAIDVIAAFLLYAVALPLVGVVIGLFLKFVLPYCLGGLIAFSAFSTMGIEIGFVTWLIGMAWALAVYGIRHQHKALDDSIALMDGHYRAVFSMLTLGVPYRREKARLQHALEID